MRVCCLRPVRLSLFWIWFPDYLKMAQAVSTLSKDRQVRAEGFKLLTWGLNYLASSTYQGYISIIYIYLISNSKHSSHTKTGSKLWKKVLLILIDGKDIKCYWNPLNPPTTSAEAWGICCIFSPTLKTDLSVGCEFIPVDLYSHKKPSPGQFSSTT